MHSLETFLWGFMGSAAVELLSLLGFYYTRPIRMPTRYSKVGFWVTRVMLALLAGLLAVGYEIEQRILAFNIGAATPLIITFMARGLRQAPFELPQGSDPPPLPPVEPEPAVSAKKEK